MKSAQSRSGTFAGNEWKRKNASDRDAKNIIKCAKSILLGERKPSKASCQAFPMVPMPTMPTVETVPP